MPKMAQLMSGKRTRKLTAGTC